MESNAVKSRMFTKSWAHKNACPPFINVYVQYNVSCTQMCNITSHWFHSEQVVSIQYTASTVFPLVFSLCIFICIFSSGQCSNRKINLMWNCFENWFEGARSSANNQSAFDKYASYYHFLWFKMHYWLIICCRRRCHCRWCCVLFCCRLFSFFSVVRHSHFVCSFRSFSLCTICFFIFIVVYLSEINYSCEHVCVWVCFEAHCSINTRTKKYENEEENENRNTYMHVAIFVYVFMCLCAYVHLCCMISIILSHLLLMELEWEWEWEWTNIS